MLKNIEPKSANWAVFPGLPLHPPDLIKLIWKECYLFKAGKDEPGPAHQLADPLGDKCPKTSKLTTHFSSLIQSIVTRATPIDSN